MVKNIALMASFALGLAAPALAQETPADEPEILVEGDREAADQSKVIHSYIRAVMQPEASGQYARFNSPVCPATFGFAKDQAPLIEERIRAVAEAAGIPVGAKGCDPNLHLVLAKDGADAVNTIRTRRKGAFGLMRPWQRDRIESGAGPVYNWHAIFPTSVDDNSNMAMQTGGGTGGVGPAAALLGEPAYNARMTNVKSRILMAEKQVIAHGFVLIERDATQGMTAMQIADFAAMRGLLSAKDGSEDLGSVDSIMRLFEPGRAPGDHPPSLTHWDLALLTALYKAPENVNANRQRSAMAITFEKVLAQSE